MVFLIDTLSFETHLLVLVLDTGEMPRETDPFRKHVQVLPNKRWKCNFCGNQYAGGATRIKAHIAGVGRYGTNDRKDVNGRVRSEAQKALKGKGVVESSNGSGGNSLTQGQHQPETSSTAIPFLNPDDISSLGLNAEEGEPDTEVPQDARTRDGPLESLPPCSGVVVNKNMPHLLTKLEELSRREADMANLETWWRKVNRKGEYWSVVQAFRQGRPLSTSQLSQVEELSKEVEEILLRDRFRIESKTLAGFSKTVEVVNIPRPSAPDFDPEHQWTLIDFSSQEGWTYAIFWQSSYDHYPPQSAALSSPPPVPVLGFGDGYYKGEDKKPNKKVKISTSLLGNRNIASVCYASSVH
ncbi:uncharacterized protein LOC115675178 [Syzygium oleosum]|uniref:uncharacterized protein LOC115675178 n=1 Tax=Syzygium oleosum TaxID=219896 RepID=UPI0024B8C8B2|nr:uncharacterized protein LOC115675178 [Syzygium oleosum]